MNEYNEDVVELLEEIINDNRYNGVIEGVKLTNVKFNGDDNNLIEVSLSVNNLPVNVTMPISRISVHIPLISMFSAPYEWTRKQVKTAIVAEWQVMNS